MTTLRTILATVVFALNVAATSRVYTLASSTGEGLEAQMHAFGLTLPAKWALTVSIGAIIVCACILLYDHTRADGEARAPDSHGGGHER